MLGRNPAENTRVCWKLREKSRSEDVKRQQTLEKKEGDEKAHWHARSEGQRRKGRKREKKSSGRKGQEIRNIVVGWDRNLGGLGLRNSPQMVSVVSNKGRSINCTNE